MESIAATLNIELNVDCPKCGAYFDLFELDNGYLNDEGELIMAACPDGHWCKEHKKFKKEVTCPECGELIKIDGIAW